MNKEEIQETLRQGECQFIFIKNNGEEREAVGTLHPDYLPVRDESVPAGNSNETDDVVTYWDIDAGGWRRFRIDQLVQDPEVVS